MYQQQEFYKCMLVLKRTSVKTGGQEKYTEIRSYVTKS